MISCPSCGVAVQPDWDWCQRCGWDPEGLRPPGWSPPPVGAAPFAPPPAAAPRPMAYAPPVLAPPASGPYAGAASTRKKRKGKEISAASIILVVLLAGARIAIRIALTEDDTTPTRVTQADLAQQAKNLPLPTLPPVWSTWTAPDGSFHADFPGTPTVVPVDVDPAEWAAAQKVSSATGGELHVLRMYELPAGQVWAEPESILTGYIDDIASQPGVTVEYRMPTTLGFLPAYEFTGVDHDDAMEGLVFHTENRVFLLISYRTAGVPSDHDQFVASFSAG